MHKPITRRTLFKMAGGVATVAAGATLFPWAGKVLNPLSASSVSAQDAAPDLSFVATDGWIYLPPAPAIGGFHPDPLGPNLAPPRSSETFTTYIFGFRNVTGQDNTQMRAQKNKAQHNAPLFWIHENVLFRLKLTNLGLALRPDLTDAHTVHWHGFRHVIPFFDGEPSTSVSVPIDRDFTYAFMARDPGTYMYHCHVEDVEHVHMGMTGLVFVRPAQDGTSHTYQGKTYNKFVFNDGDGSTGFDREFAMFLSEVWAEAHWADAHIQLPEWSDYRVDFALLNGRVYPDTIAPNGSIDPFNPVHDSNGDLIPTPGYEHLQYQPLSALVTCNAGDRVLLRFANLGFKQAAMTLAGIDMHVVGLDATPLRGSDGTDTSYVTNVISINAGESADALFTAPPYQGPGPYDTYLLYNRSFMRSDNLANGYGGQMTEIRVYPAGTLGAQTVPNT